MKRIIKPLILMLAASLALSSCVTVLPSGRDGAEFLNPPGTKGPLPMYGEIIGEDENTITVKDANSEKTVVLTLSSDVYVVDAVTGMSATVKDRASDRAAVFYGPVETRSMPPKSNAVAIAVNLPEESLTLPHYGVVESVTETEDGVKALTLTDSGRVDIAINAGTALLPYLTKNIVTAGHIREGSALMVWYGAVKTSFPAQATAEMAVLLSNPETAD
ncbi:MAG: hypothetical protein LBS19_12160 [Clostridiales bacterium]|jgi:hypothetical protein|nr:hypothetical protein [Clostridiales bacterium]